MPEQFPNIGVWGIFTILLIRGLTDLVRASRSRKANGATPMHPAKFERMATEVHELHTLHDVRDHTGVPVWYNGGLVDAVKNQTEVLTRIEKALNRRNGSRQ